MCCRYWRPDKEATIWTFHQLATALQRPLISVYPRFGTDQSGTFKGMRQAYNRVIYPIGETTHPPIAALLWCKWGTRRSTVTNHFSSLLPFVFLLLVCMVYSSVIPGKLKSVLFQGMAYFHTCRRREFEFCEAVALAGKVFGHGREKAVPLPAHKFPDRR